MSRSLEIVNDLIEDINIKNKYVFERVYNAPIKASDLETIKQDLEVLEIIRKKNVDLKYLCDALKRYSNSPLVCECALEHYNCNHNHFKNELTLEELQKLKQWLEENENDR